MKNKIYMLGHCTTWHAILEKTGIGEQGIPMQDIKLEKITPAQLEEMKKIAGSYEALFSRRALKYKEWKLKDRKLREDDYRDLILREYTFLKRPVILLGNKIFIGSEKKTVEGVREAVERLRGV
jgi:arsenate reductase